MGKVASRLSKPLREFNIENRASRVLEKQQKQGIASPKHPSTVDHISQLKHETNDQFSQEQNKNEALHEKLKGLYVENDRAPQDVKNPIRPLPESRTANPETEYGIMDTTHTIPEGRANLKTIVDFISQHQLDPNSVTVDSISAEHKLRKEDVEAVLKHFKAFNLHIPQEMYKQNKNMKKIVADQMASASKNPAAFRLAMANDDSKGDTNSNKT